jgi:hypothetical protein
MHTTEVFNDKNGQYFPIAYLSAQLKSTLPLPVTLRLYCFGELAQSTRFGFPRLALYFYRGDYFRLYKRNKVTPSGITLSLF